MGIDPDDDVLLAPVTAVDGEQRPACRLSDPTSGTSPLLSQTATGRWSGGKPWESQPEGGRRFTSQPDQRPTRRHEPQHAATGTSHTHTHTHTHTSRRFTRATNRLSHPPRNADRTVNIHATATRAAKLALRHYGPDMTGASQPSSLCGGCRGFVSLTARCSRPLLRRTSWHLHSRLLARARRCRSAWLALPRCCLE